MRRNWRTVGSGWFARPAATEFCDDSSTRVAWVVDEDLNHAMLAFEEEATGATLGVQRALEMDEQDRQFGMDSYCVVYGGSSHYGALRRSPSTNPACMSISRPIPRSRWGSTANSSYR